MVPGPKRTYVRARKKYQRVLSSPVPGVEHCIHARKRSTIHRHPRQYTRRPF
jgi:hypothetical protein